MASAAAEPVENTSQPEISEPVKRGRGRPRTSEPEPEVEPFFVRIKNFAKVDWEETLVMYLFRCGPITDRKATGKHSNIRKYAQPVDPDDIKKEFGSGDYKLTLVGLNQTTNKYQRIEEHFFTIMDIDYPPKLALGEWVDDERNKDWAWAKPALEAEQKRRMMESQGNSAMQGMDQATQMFQAAVAAVKTLRPDESPEKQTSLAHMVIQTLEKTLEKNSGNQAGMLQVVEKVIAAVKPTGEDGNQVITLVTSQLTALQAELAAERAFGRELLTKLTEKPVAPSFKDQLSDTLEVARTIRGNRSSEASGSGTSWTDVARDAIAEVSQTLRAGFQAYALKKAAESGRRVTVQNEPPVTRQPRTNALPEGSAASTAGHSQPTEEQVNTMLQQINEQFGPMFDEIAPFLAEHFRKGWTGMEFREWFLEEYGTKLYRQVRMISPDLVMGIIEVRKKVAPANIQQMLAELQPPEQVVQFVQEFLSDAPLRQTDPSWRPEEDDDEDTPDGQAQGAKSEFKEF